MGVWRRDEAASGCGGVLTICGLPGELNEIAAVISRACEAGTLSRRDLRPGRWRGRRRLWPHESSRGAAGGEREPPSTADNGTRPPCQSIRERRVLLPVRLLPQARRRIRLVCRAPAIS